MGVIKCYVHVADELCVCEGLARLKTQRILYCRPVVFISLGGCHTEAPYVIAGRTTAVHNCLALLSLTSEVQAATLVHAIV